MPASKSKLENKCLWKKISQNQIINTYCDKEDLNKKFQACFVCNGYNAKCEMYKTFNYRVRK